VKLSPRWAATSLQQADVEVSYRASNAGFGYEWKLQEKGCALVMQTEQAKVNLHLLLPPGKRVAKILANDHAIHFAPATVEKSNYVDAQIEVKKKLLLQIYFV
jgi:hypothetical protein